jgi:cell division septal protein FtsQ
MLALVFVIILLFVISSSSIFAVSQIEIFGNNRVRIQEIKTAASAETGINILSFNSGKARRELLANNYIDRVNIEKDLINGVLTITIRERILSGYIEHSSGSFIYIDENGRVLDIKSYYTEKMPIVVGLRFTEFALGQVLNVSNQVSFDCLVTLTQLFNKYEVETDVIRVDLSDSRDIQVLWGNISVSFGDISDADEKVRTAKAIIERLDDEDIKGFLDISDINKDPKFKYLT